MPGGPASTTPTKPCLVCGRVITRRKKWERDWDSVLYCSSACRRRGPSDLDRDLERAITDLLAARPPSGSICPSEAARRVRPDDWRDLMEPARQAARRLVAQGVVEITQQGHAVDPSAARGPVRVRLTRPGR